MPKAFSEQERQHIAQRLREQGRTFFATQGLRKTSVEELSSAVGISKGAFYLFYEPKEAFFMDVIEDAERHFRLEVLRSITQPGASTQLRFYHVLHTAFRLWREVPILQIFTHADYEYLARSVSPELLQAHLESDREFIALLSTRCQQEGIPIQVSTEELDDILHTLFFASLHEDDFGRGKLKAALELQIHLVAAYCVGDVHLHPRNNLIEGQDRAR